MINNPHSEFHAIAGILGLTEADKDSIVFYHSQNRFTKPDVFFRQDHTGYRNMIAELRKKSETRKLNRHPKADIWRKRVMAAVGAYLEQTGAECDDRASYIKSVACRTVNKPPYCFNELTNVQLQNVYNGFIKKREAVNNASLFCDTLSPSRN